MTEKWTPEDEERLRRALHQEASKTYPSPGGLERILSRTRREPRWTIAWRSPTVLGAAAALVTAVAAIGVGANVLGDPADDITAPGSGVPTTTTAPPTDEATPPSPDPTSEPTDPVTSPPTDEASQPPVTPDPHAGYSGALPVYFVNETRAGLRLAREWIPVDTEHNAAEEAITRMVDTPPVPGYDTLWSSATEVQSVQVRDGAIEVDLSLPATPIVQDEAELAVQQLVYTATAAASLMDRSYGSLPVRVLVDGEQVDELGGFDVAQALRRAPALDVRQLVQLNEPSQGATVRSPVRVRGDAATFEANVPWELLQNGEVVQTGYTMTLEGQRFAEFSFELDLEPGEYTIVITEDDPSGGEGGEPMSDARTFTVVD